MNQTNQVLRSSLGGTRLDGRMGPEGLPLRSGINSLARSSGIAIAGGLVSQALKALVMILLARGFGPVQFGAFSFANSVNAFLFILAQFGLPIFGAREVAHLDAVPGGLLRAITGARLLLGTIGTFVALVVLFFLPGVTREEFWLVAGFGLSNIALSFVYDWVFQGAGELHLWAVVNIAWQGLWLVFTVGVIEAKGSVVLASIGYAAAAALTALIAWPWLHRLRRNRGLSSAPRRYSMFGVLKATANLGAGTLLITVLVWTDTIIVRFVKGEEAAGVYAAGNRISLALSMLGSFYVLGAFPALSRLAAAASDEFSQHFQRVYEDLALLFVPGAAWAILFAPRIMIILFKRPDYLTGVNVFRIFQVFLLLAVASNLFGMGVLVTHGRDRAYRKVLLISAALMLVLCPMFAMRWGLEGAAAAVSLSQGLSLVLFLVESNDLVRIGHVKTLGLPLLIGIVPLLPRLIFRDAFWYSVALLAVAYLGIALWRQPLVRVAME